jgi:hypothetical protein
MGEEEHRDGVGTPSQIPNTRDMRSITWRTKSLTSGFIVHLSVIWSQASKADLFWMRVNVFASSSWPNLVATGIPTYKLSILGLLGIVQFAALPRIHS